MPHNTALQSELPADRRNRISGADLKIGPGHQSLVEELEAAIQQKNIGTRAEILRRITDLFVAGSDHFDGEQMSLFDDVMGRLLTEIEHSARVAFGERLSAIANAPPNASRTLALDDSIAVAGPVLRRSESLDDDTLVTGAKTKGQEHLLAISQRERLSEHVTDILVERGNQKVVISTAANIGARFSQFGYSTLVSRSENDSELALLVWSRPEVPREYLLTLFETASETVRLKFETADRSKTDLVRDMIKQAADQIQNSIARSFTQFFCCSGQYRAAAQKRRTDRGARLRVCRAWKIRRNGGSPMFARRSADRRGRTRLGARYRRSNFDSGKID